MKLSNYNFKYRNYVSYNYKMFLKNRPHSSLNDSKGKFKRYNHLLKIINIKKWETIYCTSKRVPLYFNDNGR